MRTKQILSVILAIAMVVSMMATLGVTASALRYSFARLAEMQNGTATLCSQKNQTSGTEIICDTNDTVTITVSPNPGYKVKTVANDTFEVVATATENVYQFNTLSDISNSIVTVVFEPDNSCILDLDSTTTNIKEKKELDQNYNLTVNEGTKPDVTKVKLSWEIKDINATRTDNKVWDTENLCWKTSTSSTEIKQEGTAKFTLENYSSAKVDAKVTFDTAEYEESKKFTAPTLVFDEDNDENTEDDGVITLETANGNDTYSKENVPAGEITVTVTPDTDDFEKLEATAAAVKYGVYTVTIAEHEEEPACIASGTMVTLANGTKKLIDDVTMNDTLMTYNFFTGKIEGNKPLYILKNDNILSSVLTLSFSDGSELEICDEQSFFDMDARDYFLISRKNYQNAEGKNIMQMKDGEIKSVTITDITLEKRYCTSYELATENAVNFVTNDIVNTPPNYFLPGTYTFGEDMKIDAEQYQKDVKKYGLYTYADFAKYITKNTFITGHIADLKIAVGKGLINEETLFAGYEEWIPVIHGTNK